MFDKLSIEALGMGALFIVPGFIIIFIRSRFITGRNSSAERGWLAFFATSLIYHACVYSLVIFFGGTPEKNELSAFIWIVWVLVAPVIVGVLLGFDTQKGWLHGFLRRMKINTVHSMPTAWDWVFSDIEEKWVIITLKSGTEFAGKCGVGSFISSDNLERDIYIEKVYRINDSKKDATWEPTNHSLLVTANEVSTIEFIKMKG